MNSKDVPTCGTIVPREVIYAPSLLCNVIGSQMIADYDTQIRGDRDADCELTQKESRASQTGQI